MNKKKLLVFGLIGAAGVGLLLATSGTANAAPAPVDDDSDEDLPEDDSDLPETDDVDDVDDEPEGEPPIVLAPVPDGRPIEDAVDDVLRRGEEVLDNARDRVVIDDGPTVTLPPPPPQIVPRPPPVVAPKPPVVVTPRPPVKTQPFPVPPLDPGESIELPDPDPVDPTTMAMLRALLAKESSPNWKAEEEIVRTWQRANGLTADAKFGPGSARLLAQKTGLIPIVRFWPRAALQHKAVPEYQAQLRELARNAEEPRRTHLLAAAEREQGQGFGTPPTPIVVRVTL